MEPSTAAESFGIPAEHPEALTDVDFVDKLEGTSALPAPYFESADTVGSDKNTDICRLFEAPIITFRSDGTAAETSSAEKENSQPVCAKAARRNIFAAAQPPSLRPTLFQPVIDPLPGWRTACWRKFETNGGAREDRKLRKTSSVSEQQLLMFQKRGGTLTKRYSETEATAEARRLDLLVSQSLDFDDGRRANLIGDFSRPCCLPLMEGAKHQDLKTISCQTV
jgi:hypothetical protein